MDPKLGAIGDEKLYGEAHVESGAGVAAGLTSVPRGVEGLGVMWCASADQHATLACCIEQGSPDRHD